MIKAKINKLATGRKIADLMRKHGMERDDLAKRLENVTTHAVDCWLVGASVPRLSTLIALAYIFECDIGDIIVAVIQGDER